MIKFDSNYILKVYSNRPDQEKFNYGSPLDHKIRPQTILSKFGSRQQLLGCAEFYCFRPKRFHQT